VGTQMCSEFAVLVDWGPKKPGLVEVVSSLTTPYTAADARRVALEARGYGAKRATIHRKNIAEEKARALLAKKEAAVEVEVWE